MKRVIIIALILVISSALIYFLLHRNSREDILKKRGDELIEKIEKYKFEQGVLPDNLAAIGVNETDDFPLYYQKYDSLNYIIWFGTSLGESITYFSDSKRWEEHFRAITLNKKN